MYSDWGFQTKNYLTIFASCFKGLLLPEFNNCSIRKTPETKLLNLVTDNRK